VQVEEVLRREGFEGMDTLPTKMVDLHIRMRRTYILGRIRKQGNLGIGTQLLSRYDERAIGEVQRRTAQYWWLKRAIIKTILTSLQ